MSEEITKWPNDIKPYKLPAGQCAFPFTALIPPNGQIIEGGLTKREWFAGMALMGFCASETGKVDKENVPILCVEQADALIAEL